jgi:hypothetical protein
VREKTGGAAAGLGKQSVVYVNANWSSARKLCRHMTYENSSRRCVGDAEIYDDRGH